MTASTNHYVAILTLPASAYFSSTFLYILQACLYVSLLLIDTLVCSTISIFVCMCVYNVSSCGQWDGVELPLCEAFHQQDSWGSPETTSDPSHANTEDSEHLGTQESIHRHLNGHGSSTSEQS